MANDDKGMVEILLLSLLKIFTSCNDLKYELSIKNSNNLCLGSVDSQW